MEKVKYIFFTNLRGGVWGEGEQEMFHDKLIFTQVGDVSPLLIWACTGSRRSDVQKNEMFDSVL